MDQIGILRFYYRSFRGSGLTVVGSEGEHAALLTQQCGVVATWTCISGSPSSKFGHFMGYTRCSFSWFSAV